MRDARRLNPLLVALATGDDSDRVRPADAVFLLDQATGTVQVRLPVPTSTVGADVQLELVGELIEVDGRSPELLTGLGVPAEFADEPVRWDGWTVGSIRTAFAALAKVADWTMGQLLRELAKADFTWLEKRVLDARAAVGQLEAPARGGTAIPPDAPWSRSCGTSCT